MLRFATIEMIAAMKFYLDCSYIQIVIVKSNATQVYCKIDTVQGLLWSRLNLMQ